MHVRRKDAPLRLFPSSLADHGFFESGNMPRLVTSDHHYLLDKIDRPKTLTRPLIRRMRPSTEGTLMVVVMVIVMLSALEAKLMHSTAISYHVLCLSETWIPFSLQPQPPNRSTSLKPLNMLLISHSLSTRKRGCFGHQANLFVSKRFYSPDQVFTPHLVKDRSTWLPSYRTHPCHVK